MLSTTYIKPTFNTPNLEGLTNPEKICQNEIIAPYYERLKDHVSKKRFGHCVRVSILATQIAEANHFTAGEIAATALAGFLHDVARELDEAETFALVTPQTPLEKKKHLTLHGKAGRKIAQQWGVTDLRVLQAIEGHVFGVSSDDCIGMAVYIADGSEPARNVNQDIRELALRNLEEAYKKALANKVNYLQAKGKPVHPTTLEMYQRICQPLVSQFA